LRLPLCPQQCSAYSLELAMHERFIFRCPQLKAASVDFQRREADIRIDRLGQSSESSLPARNLIVDSSRARRPPYPVKCVVHYTLCLLLVCCYVNVLGPWLLLCGRESAGTRTQPRTSSAGSYGSTPAFRLAPFAIVAPAVPEKRRELPPSQPHRNPSPSPNPTQTVIHRDHLASVCNPHSIRC
jgi:hypothetical protein